MLSKKSDKEQNVKDAVIVNNKEKTENLLYFLGWQIANVALKFELAAKRNITKKLDNEKQIV